MLHPWKQGHYWEEKGGEQSKNTNLLRLKQTSRVVCFVRNASQERLGNKIEIGTMLS